MPDEITRRGDRFVIYRSADWGPAVPYPPAHRPEAPDRPNNGFIDLRDRPDLVDSIMEVSDLPGLRAVLKVLNSKNSPLMSLGCERQLNLLDQQDAGLGQPTCYLNSYTEIAYRDAATNSTEQSLFELADQIIERLDLKDTDWVEMELGVERMKIFFGFSDCHCLDVSISAYGRSEPESYAVHAAICERLSIAISDICGIHASNHIS